MRGTYRHVSFARVHRAETLLKHTSLSSRGADPKQPATLQTECQQGRQSCSRNTAEPQTFGRLAPLRPGNKDWQRRGNPWEIALNGGDGTKLSSHIWAL